MTIFQLFIAFFKTGLFALGGGYATLPFLSNISDTYGWYSQSQLADFLAIAEITPGAIGINMATFAGYSAAGVVGGIVASIALVLPAVIIILTLSCLVPDYRERTLSKKIFYGIMPVAIALLAVTTLQLFSLSLLTYTSLPELLKVWLLFVILLLLYLPKYAFKVSPFLILFLGGLWGFLFL